MSSELIIGQHRFRSRLIVGTGKYPCADEMRNAIEASGAEMVTVAIGRVDLSKRGAGNILDELDWKRYTILHNTAGAYLAKDAIRRFAHQAREAGLSDLIKLEVIGSKETLLPGVVDLLRATEELALDGFHKLLWR